MPKYALQTSPGLLLVLIRHASTAFNNPKKPVVRGWFDAPLSDKGRIEAQLAGDKLKQYDIKSLFHSDFMRDSETAQIIASKLNIPVEADFDARTLDTGIFSGKPESEVNPAIIEFYKRPWETLPGSSESINDFSQRWTKFLDNKMQLASIDSFRPLGIVTHGRDIAWSQSYVDFINPLDCWMPYPAGYALISVGLDRSLNFEIVPPMERIIRDV